LDDPTALNDILKLTDHSSTEFRRAAVWALGFIADPRARKTLEKLKADASPLVRLNAQRALAKLALEPQHATESVELERVACTEVPPSIAVEEPRAEEQTTVPVFETTRFSVPIFKTL
jgi:HEAT repeat protein